MALNNQEIHFTRLENEQRLCFMYDEGNSIVLLALYVVDDLVNADSSQKAFTMVKDNSIIIKKW